MIIQKRVHKQKLLTVSKGRQSFSQRHYRAVTNETKNCHPLLSIPLEPKLKNFVRSVKRFVITMQLNLLGSLSSFEESQFQHENQSKFLC